MPVLYRASFGYLIRHPWQLALAVLGISMGVAVMVAVDLANESSRRAFNMSMDDVNGEATHQVVAGPQGVDETLYVQLRRHEGLRNIAPVVEGYVDVRNTTLYVLGIDVFAERNFRSYRLRNATGDAAESADGGASAVARTVSATSSEGLVRSFLTEPGAVIMSGMTADTLGLTVGIPFDLEARGRKFSARLAALITAADERASGNLLVTDIANAQQWLGTQGRLSRIDVRITAQPDTPEYADAIERINTILPTHALLLPADARSRSVGEMSEAFMTNLTAMSLLALLIGIFLIYNSVGFAVLQRRSLIGVLRAIGMTRAGTVRLILFEALALGTVGAALGLALGYLLAQELLALVSRSINDLYYVVNVTGVSVTPGSIFKGFAVGLGATLVAAAVPAIEAASYPPGQAMARSALEVRSGWLARRVAVAGALTAALGLLLLPLSGTALVPGLVAVFMLIFGLALCIPVTVRGISNLLAPLASTVGGLGLRLAIAGTGASLSRTGVAIVALAVAVSATVGVSTMVDSFRASVGDWLDNTLRADIYVGVAGGTIDPDIARDLQSLPGIADYSISRRVWLESQAGRTRVTAIEMAEQSFSGVMLEQGDRAQAWTAFEEQGAILVSGSYAYRQGVGPGDSVSLRTPLGERKFDIAAVYRSYDADLDAILMSRSTYVSIWEDLSIGSLGIYVEEAVDIEDVIGDMRRISEGRQALIINANRDLRERSMQVFDRTFVITDVLYWLALSVAATGILGAMLALQLERARELALYRALGMTPLQLGRMVVVQTAFIGLLSGLAAVPLGLAMALVLINVINRRAFGWQMDFTVEPSVLGSAILLSIIAAMLAGVYPAWRAAQANPALAMREE